MGDRVTLRPVIEDDLPWLASLEDGPAATGVHEWHGWSESRWMTPVSLPEGGVT